MNPPAIPAPLTRPFYFGPDEGLFGVLDLPPGDGERAAVVLFQPVGHEATWCHRACRALAAKLAEAGHPVLRFDYSGCGDSAGESEDADLARWTADGRAAIAYMRARYAEVVAVGLRLGATLALLARETDAGVARLALWQPIVEGSSYLAELRARHAAHARGLGLEPEARATGEEVLGFVYSKEAVREFGELDLAAASAGGARVLHLVNQPGEDQRALAQLLRRAASTLEELHVPEPHAWVAEPYKMVMPLASLDALVTWVAEGER